MAHEPTERTAEAAPGLGCIHLRDPSECAECANRRRVRLYKAVILVSALSGVGFGLALIFTW